MVATICTVVSEYSHYIITYCLVQVTSEPFGGTDLKPESSRNTQALNIAEDQHFLRKKRIA